MYTLDQIYLSLLLRRTPHLSTMLTSRRPQVRMKPDNTCNSLQYLLRILRPIIIFLLTIKIRAIIQMIINLPKRRWSRWAMDVVIPISLAYNPHSSKS